MSDWKRRAEHEQRLFEWNRRRQEEGMIIFRKQAQAKVEKNINDPGANFTLAQYYARGWGGLRKWPYRALHHCKVAAENKHPEACVEMAKFYLGVKSDLRDENSPSVDIVEAKKYIEMGGECIDDTCLVEDKDEVRKDVKFCLGVISRMEEDIKGYEERFGPLNKEPEKEKKRRRCLML